MFNIAHLYKDMLKVECSYWISSAKATLTRTLYKYKKALMLSQYRGTSQLTLCVTITTNEW